jgi:hypothetical protein
MEERQEQRAGGRIMLGALSKYPLIGIILGIILIVFGLAEVVPYLAKPVDPGITELSDFRKGQHVCAEVYVAYDYLLTEVFTKEENGREVSSTERYRYYGIPYFEEGEDGVSIDRLLVVKVPKKHYGYFEVAADRFEKWWMDTSGTVNYPKESVFTVNGILKPMKDDEWNQIKNYFNGTDVTDRVIPYVLQMPDEFEIGGWFMMAVLFGGLGLFFYIENKRDKEEQNLRLYRAVDSNYFDVPENPVFDHNTEDDK